MSKRNHKSLFSLLTLSLFLSQAAPLRAQETARFAGSMFAAQQTSQPAVPPTAPADTNLPAPQAPAQSAPAQPQPGAPGGQVRAPVGPPAPGRESMPVTPDAQLNVPQVAPDFKADEAAPFPA